MVKNVRLQVRMTEPEKALLELAAEKSGKTVAEFVRVVMLDYARTAVDYSTGAIGFDKARDILNYNTTSVLKSATAHED